MEDLALYIHIPFCKRKCLYCDFPSFSNKEYIMVDYCKALSKEIESIGGRKVKTIFIGGGTPTYLSAHGWNLIKKSIDNLNKASSFEFTVEGNPGTFSIEILEIFKKMGVNRLSIGLQAWQDSLLKKLGRIHTIEDFKKSYEMARNLNFNNINIDLMFGIPDQTMENWKETLENIIKLNPEHISCYGLIVEEGTYFNKLFKIGQLDLPGEEIEMEMYSFTKEILKENGYKQYEISNFAKKDKECRHNLVYWDLENYIGCGSSSHSFYNGTRYSNEINIEKYIQDINNTGDAVVFRNVNSNEDNEEEFMFLGLRKINGISTEDFEKRFAVPIDKIYGDVINKFIKSGLLMRENNRIFLTPRGIEISNIVMCEFMLS